MWPAYPHAGRPANGVEGRHKGRRQAVEEKAIEDVPDEIIAIVYRLIQEAVEQGSDQVRKALIQQLVADVRIDSREAIYPIFRLPQVKVLRTVWDAHNTNPPGVFGGPVLDWITVDAARDAEALAVVRHFVEEHRQVPTQESWTGAGMSPCETTVRSRFGSFRAAVEAAGGSADR